MKSLKEAKEIWFGVKRKFLKELLRIIEDENEFEKFSEVKYHYQF